MTRPLIAGVLTGVLGAALLVVGGSPARADHQNCGANYPTGTLSNGHPDLSTGDLAGWAGQRALNDAEAAVFGTGAAKTLLLDAAAVVTGIGDVLTAQAKTVRETTTEPVETPAATPIEAIERTVRIVATAITVGGLVALIAETAAMATERSVAGAVGGENACNDVIMGDMLSALWVSTVEENLASDGPPLAVLLTPTDSEEPGGDSGQWPLQPQHEKGDFGWCPPIDIPSKELPTPAPQTDLDQPDGATTGGDCSPTVIDGMLTDPYEGAPALTVQAIVRDTIAHAKAHKLPVRDAQAEYDEAVRLAGEGRYKKAFAHFRLAYQAAAGFDG